MNGIPLTGRFAEIIAPKNDEDAQTRLPAFRIVEKPLKPLIAEDGTMSLVAGKGHIWQLELRQSDGVWRPHSTIVRPKEEADDSTVPLRIMGSEG